MYYYYNKMFSEHWSMISSMIDENYIDNTNVNSAMILGSYLHKPVRELKIELDNNGVKYDKTIVYQLEPLLENHWWKPKHILKHLDGADEVWDYDLQNIEFLRKHGIEAKFRPPTYTESLKTIQNSDNPDIDVLFYGSFTPHRSELMRKLHNDTLIPPGNEDLYSKINFVWLYNICDSKLHEFIGRSKIILNMNPLEGESRQQQTRIFYALNNDKCVLSEKSPINYFGDSIVEFTGHQELSDKLVYLLSQDRWKIKSINYNKYFTNKNNKTKKAIFYHIYQVGDWARIFEEQIMQLQKSGLFDEVDYIHIGINGDQPLPFNLHKINRIKYNLNKHLEADTLSDLHSFCLSNPDYKVLYMHAKGVTWHQSDVTVKHNVRRWREYMEYFAVEKWRECCKLLDDCDCVGTEWEEIAYIHNTEILSPHYAGNFWWANASYINKLDLNYLFEENHWTRWKGEFWIGTGNPKYHNFYSSGINKYTNQLEPKQYKL